MPLSDSYFTSLSALLRHLILSACCRERRTLSHYIFISAPGRRPLCQFGERVAGNPIYRPFTHRYRSQREIKFYAGLIPVEAPPFQTTAAPFHRNMGEFFHSALSVSPSAEFRLNIEIFQINSPASEKCGKIMKKTVQIRFHDRFPARR